MSKEKSSRSLPGWIELGTILTLLAPLLYTAGWSYACHYFERFHLGLLGLNIPREYFFLYSFWVIREEFLSFLVLLFILLAVSLVWGYHRQVATAMIARGRSGGLFAIRVIVVPIFILILFLIFYALGGKAAQSAYKEEKMNGFPSYPRARVWVKQGGGDSSAAMAKEWEKGCYRLLMRNNGDLYLFYPGGSKDKLPIDIIPARDVECVRILPQYHGCRE